MRIIRNYILEEFLTHFATILVILTFFLLLGNAFTKMVDLVINQGGDLFKIFQLFAFLTPYLFVFTVPMSASVATLLTFGRLSADHELVALKASGLSLRRIARPVLIVSLLLSGCCFLLNDQVASRCHFLVRRISSEIGLKTPAALLEEGVFIKSFKGLVIFVHRIDQNRLRQIRIYQPQAKGPTRTIIAEEGELIPVPELNMVKLRLKNGTSDEPDAANPGRFYRLRFGSYVLPLDLSGYRFREPVDRKRKEMTVRELYLQHRKILSQGFSDPYVITEIHARAAMALACFLLCLLSLPLAIRVHRSEKTIGFAIALLLGTVYWALLMASVSLCQTRILWPWIGPYLPNFLFLTAGLWLYRKVLRS